MGLNKFMRVCFPSTLFLMLLLLGTALSISGQNKTWSPVTPAELAMKTPKVDPNADAEALFWEIHIDDQKLNSVTYNHYVRIKIFTERGRDKYAKMDIPFTKKTSIDDIAARVIKPDGTIIDLKPSDIFERELVKANKTRILAKSFAVPGIEPGVIVEYQYKETIKDDSVNGDRLVFQRDIPMQKVSYYVRPIKQLLINYHYFNMQQTDFVPDRDGYSVATMYDVPAYSDEPYMPPDDEVRRWVSVSYAGYGVGFSWFNVARNYVLYLAEHLKPNKDIKRKADELTANTPKDEDKLRKIYDFTQKQIRNLSYDRTLTDDQREKLKVKDATDALKKGMGSEFMVDMLFATLAKAAGFDVRLVLSGNRSENFFTPEKYEGQRFIHLAGVGIQSGNNLTCYEPGVPYMPFGSVFWFEEGISSMVTSDGGWNWKILPITPFEKSLTKRTGKFKLTEDGTLEGHARVEYYGHEAITKRRDHFTETPEKRAETFKESVRSRVSTAEVTNVTVSDFDDNEKPVAVDYDVKVPNYAQRTGKRLFFQPVYFEYGVPPAFSSTTRTYGVYFSYPWSEDDNVEITLPDNFTGESVISPSSIDDPDGVGSLHVSFYILKESNRLNVSRQFHFGGGGHVIFPLKFYQPVKAMFDGFNKADSTTVTLKQK